MTVYCISVPVTVNKKQLSHDVYNSFLFQELWRWALQVTSMESLEEIFHYSYFCFSFR